MLHQVRTLQGFRVQGRDFGLREVQGLWGLDSGASEKACIGSSGLIIVTGRPKDRRFYKKL